MKYYKIWCEWDIGINDYIFSSYDIAVSHIKEALVDADFDESDGFDYSIEALTDEGLLGIEEGEMLDA